MAIRGHGNGMEMAQFRDQQNRPCFQCPVSFAPGTLHRHGLGGVWNRAADERVKVRRRRRIPRASRRPQRNSMPWPRPAPSGVPQHCWRGTWGRPGADWFHPAERTQPMAPPRPGGMGGSRGKGTLRSSQAALCLGGLGGCPGPEFGGGVAPRDARKRGQPESCNSVSWPISFPDFLMSGLF